MSASPPSKAAKVDEEACLKQDSIPIHGVSRMLRFKVADEVSISFLFSNPTADAPQPPNAHHRRRRWRRRRF